MATDKNRFTISVDDDLFNKIEDYRFERRFQTRSEATAELISIGLASLDQDEKIAYIDSDGELHSKESLSRNEIKAILEKNLQKLSDNAKKKNEA